ncbi:MAG: PAS domain S-box protein, partial [Anaerolineae bacterium]|nr:PAS domain S-box protein [Anaerolineae bacterium]
FDDLPDPGEYLDPLQWTIPDLERRLNLVVRAIGIALSQVVALPLTVHDVLVGVIYVLRQEGTAFTFSDRRVLSAFAAQAGIAIHNARLYQEVTREKQRLDAIMENSGDGVMILTAEQLITVFNRALTSMTGVPAEEALGKYCWQVVPLRDHNGDQVIEELSCPAEHCQDGERFYVEGDYVREDGIRVTLGITYSPLLDHEGQLVNIIANVRDITHFHEAEEMKSTFISVISHELKTPVALIKGYAGTLRREDADWDPAVVQQGLCVIEDEADRLTGLIENLLSATKLQAEGMQLKYEDVRLDRIAQAVVERFKTQTDTHEFVLEFPPAFPVIPGDSTRLRQVIDNLVGNAVKYSPGGGTIRVAGSYTDKQVRIEVQDEGVGLPQDEWDRIFERFYRVDDALTRRTQGTGLGLYLAQAVVQAHGGKIGVHSVPGKGSTFHFTLPRHQAYQ